MPIIDFYSTVLGMEEQRTAHQRLADILLGEPVEQWVAARRAERISWRKISLRLRDQHKLDIGEPTLRAWALAAEAEAATEDAPPLAIAAAGGA